MKSKILVAIAVLTLVGLPLAAHAQMIGLFADQVGTNPFIQDIPGLVTIYVVVVNSPPMTAVQFSAPLPACFTGVTYLSDATTFPIILGNSQTGVSVGFGGCVSSPIQVLAINVLAQGLTDPTVCCLHPILPDPSVPSGKIEFFDCTSTLVFGTGLPAVVGDGTPAPPLVGDPSPLHGAAAQLLDSKLSWSLTDCSFTTGIVWNDVFFGTTLDPPLVASSITQVTYDPGPLQPSTIYYWKIHASGDGGTTVGPVWTFGTEVPVPIEQTTWGRVKALYTD